MQNELKIFENPEFGRIRTMEINGEPYFVGKDVAEILGYKNTRDAVLKHVDDNNKRICCINTTNGIHRLVAISEVGLFQLINNSKLLTIKNIRPHCLMQKKGKVRTISLPPSNTDVATFLSCGWVIWKQTCRKNLIKKVLV